MNITIVANMRAKEGKQEELKDSLMQVIEPTRNESGCVSYHIHQHLEDNRNFTAYEVWVDKASVENHMKSEHMLGNSERTKDIIESFDYDIMLDIKGE